jgi:hypothetical protein
MAGNWCQTGFPKLTSQFFLSNKRTKTHFCVSSLSTFVKSSLGHGESVCIGQLKFVSKLFVIIF